MSRLTCNKFAICITPEDICPRDNWGIRGEMVGKDLVHLTETGIKLLTEVTHRAILSLEYPPPPPPNTGWTLIATSLQVLVFPNG